MNSPAMLAITIFACWHLHRALYRTGERLGHKSRIQTDKYHDDRGEEWIMVDGTRPL